MRTPVCAVVGLLMAVASASQAAAQCAGDCNGDRMVVINEVITCVNTGLGVQPGSQCEACDANGDGMVAINEIISGVNIGLGLLPCEADMDTPTPTPTGTPVVTTTPGDSGEAEQVEAIVSSIVSSFADLANTGDSGGAATGSGAIIDIFPITSPCPGGGTQTFDCSEGGSGTEISVLFDECVSTAGQTRTRLDGNVTATSSGVCLGNPFPLGQPVTQTFDGTIVVTDLGSGETFSVDSDVTVDYVVETSRTVRLNVSGMATASCLDGTASLDTLQEIVIPAGSDCATAGRLRIALSGQGTHEVEYTSSGGVNIDLGADGSVDSTFASCSDAELTTCGGLSD